MKAFVSLALALAWAAQSSQRLFDLDGTDDRIQELQAQQEQLREELAEAAAALSDARTEAAGRLAKAVTAELALLAMPHARLTIDGSPGARVFPQEGRGRGPAAMADAPARAELPTLRPELGPTQAFGWHWSHLVGASVCGFFFASSL